MIKLVLWGTGGRARELFSLRLEENFQIVSFIDSDPNRHGEFLGYKVTGPTCIRELDFDYVFIASTYYEEIYKQVVELGVEPHRILPSHTVHFLLQDTKLTSEELKALTSVPFWYHRFEILPGVITPGCCNYKPHLVNHPELQDVTGKRFLDIGAWDGPYTKEMTRRGGLVTAFDIQPPSHSAFNVIRPLKNSHFHLRLHSH